MSLESQSLSPAGASSQAPGRRPWTPPRARRLATSEAENSTDLGPDAETVTS